MTDVDVFNTENGSPPSLSLFVGVVGFPPCLRPPYLSNQTTNYQS